MSQQQPPGWGPPPGHYPPQQGHHPQHQGQYQQHGQGYGQGHPPQPQQNGSGAGRVVLWVIGTLAALLVVGVIGFGALAWYAQNERFGNSAANQEAVRERQRIDQSAAEAEHLRQREEAARIEAEKKKARSGQLLETSNLVYYDKGWINNYRQLTGITVLNRSKYPVNGLGGNVEWLDDGGRLLGSVPFTLGGSLLPGDTRRYTTDDGSLRNGTLQSNATKARIIWTSVTIVE